MMRRMLPDVTPGSLLKSVLRNAITLAQRRTLLKASGNGAKKREGIERKMTVKKQISGLTFGVTA